MKRSTRGRSTIIAARGVTFFGAAALLALSAGVAFGAQDSKGRAATRQTQGESSTIAGKQADAPSPTRPERGGLPKESAAAQKPGDGAPAAPPVRFDASLERRLVALDPSRPHEYLLLAEEVEARAAKAEERELARQLYGLAGALDPVRLGASAALAQANLAEGAADRARLLRLGAALRPSAPATERDRTPPAAVMRFAPMLGAYRRGHGARVREFLANDEVAALVDLFGEHFEGGAAGFRNAVATLRDQPVETSARMLELMWIEEALLSAGGEDEDIVADLIRSGGEPLAACDPLRPGPELGVDPDAARWRDGRWVAD